MSKPIKHPAASGTLGDSGNLNDNNLSGQGKRILSYLREHGQASTITLRHELNILAPAPRVFELRHFYGFNIVTNWIIEATPEGKQHNVALYVLRPGKWRKDA